MTNYGKIKTMKKEELVDFINNILTNDPINHHCYFEYEECSGREDMNICKNCIKEWLSRKL